MMINYLVTLITVLLIYVMVDGQTLIYGTKPGQFPYQVSIQKELFGSYYHVCSGTILAPKWLLTHALCTLGSIAVAGIISINATDVYHQERRIINFFTPTNYSYEIALAELDEALVYNKFVNSVDLPKLSFSSNKVPTIIGWMFDGIIAKDILQFTPAPLVSEKVCNKVYPDHRRGAEGCFGPLNEVCLGYSGDPLIQERTIIGIASYAKAFACERGYPQVYIRVLMYLDFILEHVEF